MARNDDAGRVRMRVHATIFYDGHGGITIDRVYIKYPRFNENPATPIADFSMQFNEAAASSD